MRFEAKVGRIHSIQILSHMRSIGVDDINILEVQAFDKEGNVFSTVEGLNFQWRIEENPQSLKFINIKDAHFKTTEKKVEMERKRMMTDISLLKGLKTGKSVISVQLMEDGYEQVERANITLSVIEPFTLDPSYPVYILPNSEFSFGILKMKIVDTRFVDKRVSLPSPDYVFFTDNEEAGVINNSGVFRSRNIITTVLIRATDVAISTNTAENLVHIVPPESLEIEVFDITDKISASGVNEYANLIYNSHDGNELKNLKSHLIELHENFWILVEERFYLVNMFLLDQSKHEIKLTDNLLFNFKIDAEYLEIFNVGNIQTQKKQTSNLYIIKAKKTVNKTPSVGKLSEVKSVDTTLYGFDYSRLIVERSIRITSQVKIIHPTPEVRLPYLGYFRLPNKSIEKQLWHLQSSGGTGNYEWDSQDENIVIARNNISLKTVGEIRGNNLGATIVKVSDALNPFNFATIPVYVTKVGTLMWLEDRIEQEKGGSEDYSHLIAYDDEGKKYTNCSSLIYNLNMRREDEGIVRIKTTHLNWNQTKEFIDNNLDLIKLRNRFDDNINAVEEKDLPKNSKFDEIIQLHNNFGICGSDKFITMNQGLARIRASLPIDHDTIRYSKPIESEDLQIASYETPSTISPSYENFFEDLYYPKQPVQNTRYFSQLYLENTFKISYGSSLYWIYNGGTNYWADDLYSMKSSVEDNEYGIEVECLSSHPSPLANRITYKFTWLNTYLNDLKEYSISISMQNKLTRSLLRPKKTFAKVNLHWVIPKSVELWWAQNDKILTRDEYVNMPDYVMENNEKTYFLRNNQNRYMRALVFDKNKLIIFNTTSLVIDFTADLTNKLEFEDFGRNDKKMAQFKKESGVVYAHVNIPKDINGNKIYDVSNKKRVKLIEKVKINPLFQTRYLHSENTAEFYIIDGSNSFRVKSNSTTIANLNHITSMNTIEMSPQNEGAVEIIVEDLGVEVLETASAEFLVSDIYRIELTGGGLIEVGNSMNLTIEVYDSQNKKFNKSQLKYMEIKPEIEKVGSNYKEGLEITRINEDTFTVVGIQSDHYRVSVVGFKRKLKSERITSNFVRIEVFNIVKIVPDSILLFPGGRWTIQVEGGPSGGSGGSVYRDYEVEDQTIAEIDEYGEILGKLVGETWLKLNLYYKSNNQRQLLTSKKSKIRIALITAIEIPMMNERSVFANSLTRLNVKMKHNKETFLHALGPLSFDWQCSSPHVYTLSLPSRKDSKGGSTNANLMLIKTSLWNGETKVSEEFTTNFNYSSIVGVANKYGDARISVRMVIEYPKEYKYEKNFFSDTVRIKIIDMLTMEVPEFIENPTKEPHIYILPPLSQNKIVTNKDAKVKLAYSIQTGIHHERGLECLRSNENIITDNSEDHRKLNDSPILRILDGGYLQTLDKYGKATVVIEENQSFENQIVMLNIMISQIFSISIEKPYTALNLPMGSETNLKVTFQEENARSFADKIEGVDLFIENSHPHVVKASLDYYNSTLNLNALGIGEANIRVFTRDNIFDVIRVKVLSSILPHSPVQLHVGGVVQFVFSDKDATTGAKWRTEDTSILNVDPVYGKAEGIAEGAGKVIYEGGVNLVSLVNVKKIDRIELESTSKPEFFTNTRSNKYYKDEHHLLLNVYLEDGLSEILPEVIVNGKSLIKQNVKLTWETEDSAFAIVFAKIVNNRYACILRPHSDSTPTGKIPNSIRILVRAASNYPRSYKTEEVFEIPFVSFFKINYPSKTINFYSDERFKSIDVISNTDFNVYIEGNSDLINYRIQENKDYQNHYEIQFSIPSSVYEEFKDLKVKISNSLAETSEIFFVSYFNKPRSSFSHEDRPIKFNENRDNYDNTAKPSKGSSFVSICIILIIVVGFCVVLVYFCWIKPEPGFEQSDSSFYDSNSNKRNNNSDRKKVFDLRSQGKYQTKS